MSDAVWLYDWFLWRQTRRNGLVLGGAPLTYARIKEQTGYPIRNMQRWLKKLTQNGYVEVTYLNFKQMRIRVLKSKKFGFKQLSLAIEQPPATTGGTSPGPSAKSGGRVPPKVAGQATKSGGFKQSGTLSSNETPERESTLPGFDRFYAEYPRKIDPTRARAAWIKIPFLEQHADEVMVGLARWAISEQWRDEQFIPHPATFLNNHRWKVEPPKENQNGQRESFDERRRRESQNAIREVRDSAEQVVREMDRRLPEPHRH